MTEKHTPDTVGTQRRRTIALARTQLRDGNRTVVVLQDKEIRQGLVETTNNNTQYFEGLTMHHINHRNPLLELRAWAANAASCPEFARRCDYPASATQANV